MRRLLALAFVALVTVAPVLVAQRAAASPTDGGPAVVRVPANAAGSCLASGKVWLVVVTDTGRTLANQCVGRPSNGMAALGAAGLSVTFSDGGYICTMGGYPAKCPATYDGRFWHYYHSTTGGSWSFSTVGAAAYRYPSTGMIDGWCYSSASSSSCTPPRIAVVAPAPTATATRTATATAKPKPAPTTARTTAKATGTSKVTATTRVTATSRPAAPRTTATTVTHPATVTHPTSQASTPPVSSRSSSARPSSAQPSVATASPDVSASATATSSPPSVSASPVVATPPPPDQGNAWGVIGTGVVVVGGAAAFAGWRWLRPR